MVVRQSAWYVDLWSGCQLGGWLVVRLCVWMVGLGCQLGCQALDEAWMVRMVVRLCVWMVGL